MGKKLKIKSKKKMPDGGKVPIKGTKEQYQAYQDSLSLYNFGEKAKKLMDAAPLEKKGKIKANGLENPKFNGEYIYSPLSNLESNPQIGIPSSYVDKFTGKTLRKLELKQIPLGKMPNQFGTNISEEYMFEDMPKNYNLYKNLPVGFDYSVGEYNRSRNTEKVNGKLVKDTGWRVEKDTREIKKTNHWDSKSEEYYATPNFTKPVQPIIYQPEQRNMFGEDRVGNGKNSAMIPSSDPSRVDGNTYFDNKGRPQKLMYNPGDINYFREIEQPIQLNRQEGLLPSNQPNLEFNPIPYKKGSYFTREQQGQEVGGKEYFDKKTGKKLEFGGQINELDMTKNGKKIKLKKAQNGFGGKEYNVGVPEGMFRDPKTGELTYRNPNYINQWGNNQKSQQRINRGRMRSDKMNDAIATNSLKNMQISPEEDMWYNGNFQNTPGNMQSPWNYQPNSQQTYNAPQVDNWQMPQYQLNERKWATPSAPTGMENKTQVKDLQPFNTTFKNSNNNTEFSLGISASPFDDPYSRKAKYYRKQATENFSQIDNTQVPQNQGLIGSKWGGKVMQNGGNAQNIVGGISNAMLADINDAKSYINTFGTFGVNQQVQGIENQARRENLVSQYENQSPQFSGGWGGMQPLEGAYIPVGKYGGKYGFGGDITHGHQLEVSLKQGTVEVEKVGGNPEILITKDKVMKVGKKSHKRGGTVIDITKLGDGGQAGILSSHLIDPMTDLPYSENAKKLSTEKDLKFKKDNFRFLDPINLKTNERTVNKKVELAQLKFQQQEQDVMAGLHGLEPIKSRMENTPTSKHGGMVGKLPKFQLAGNVPTFPYSYTSNSRQPFESKKFKTPQGYTTPHDINLNFPPPTDYETHAEMLERKRGSQFKDFGEYQDYSYENALKSPKGQEAINKMWLKYGLTNTEESKFPDIAKKLKAGTPLTKEELQKVKTNFVDKTPGKRIIDYVDDEVTPTQLPVTPQERLSTEREKITIDPVTGRQRRGGFNGINILGGLPEAYQRDAITVNNLSPEFYDPNVISPYINDIQRAQFAANQNLGTSGAELATRANLFGQGATEYGKRYYDASVYNAGVKNQAAASNAKTKMDVSRYNMDNYVQNARNPQLQREANITMDKRNRFAEQEGAMRDMDYENRARNYWGEIYDPTNISAEQYYEYMNPPLTKKKSSKFGGKISIKKKK